MAAEAVGNAQQWLRGYSERLASSYESSGRIKHCVTKGKTREGQVLDLLEKLLPKRAALERNVVIADSRDSQSPEFDGVLADRLYWPRLFQQKDTAVVMLESVLAAIEVKSHLNHSEMKDIFGKSAALRAMKCAGEGAVPCRPVVVAFAYTCGNLFLAFFDFACAYARAPELSPTVICVLNKGLICLCTKNSRGLVCVQVPSPGLVPAAFTGRDALFMFLYSLSALACGGSASLDVYRAYGQQVFSGAIATYFDNDYLSAVAQNSEVREKARKAYFRAGKATFTELYETSRTSIGLAAVASG